MKVLLIDIDSKIPNLALKKIEKYYLDKEDEVYWNFPLMRFLVDKIYVSCIYTWNKAKCKEWQKDAEIGGSGWDLRKVLPKEIEKVKPKINLGFTTRGCIRNCEFCIVQEKEGKIRIEGDIYDIWDGKYKEITLLDNNILALPKHFLKICSQIQKENLKVDFNQGLDIRLVTPEIARALSKLIPSNKFWRFAFDEIKIENKVRKGIELLLSNNVSKHRIFFYVLVGFNDTIEEEIRRAEILHEYGVDIYFMFYNNFEVKNHRIIPKVKDYIYSRLVKENTKMGMPRGCFEKFVRYCNSKYFEGELKI